MDVTIEKFEEIEAFTNQVLEQSGWNAVDVADGERIEIVVERAFCENALRDGSTFLFEGIGSALNGLGGALLGSVKMDGVDYKA